MSTQNVWLVPPLIYSDGNYFQNVYLFSEAMTDSSDLGHIFLKKEEIKIEPPEA